MSVKTTRRAHRNISEHDWNGIELLWRTNSKQSRSTFSTYCSRAPLSSTNGLLIYSNLRLLLTALDLDLLLLVISLRLTCLSKDDELTLRSGEKTCFHSVFPVVTRLVWLDTCTSCEQQWYNYYRAPKRFCFMRSEYTHQNFTLAPTVTMLMSSTSGSSSRSSV
jgi:hypothetical protein